MHNDDKLHQGLTTKLMDHPLNFDNLAQLREIMFSSKKMFNFDENVYSSKPKIKTKSDLKSSKLKHENKNFFMSCPISRCSSTMAECSQVNS